MNSKEALERLHTLTVIMDKLFEIGTWNEEMLNMGINFDESSREDLALLERIYEIFCDMKDTYDKIDYLNRPVIAEGILTQVGDFYMINDYILKPDHDLEIIIPPQQNDDDYNDPCFESNPARIWEYFQNLKDFKKYFSSEVDGLHVRVRLSKDDVRYRFLMTM